MLTMITIFRMVYSSVSIKIFSTPSFYSFPNEYSPSGWTTLSPLRTKGSYRVLASSLVLNTVSLENAVLNGFITNSGSQIVQHVMEWGSFGFRRGGGGNQDGGRRGSLVEWLEQCRWWMFFGGRLVTLGNHLQKQSSFLPRDLSPYVIDWFTTAGYPKD